jgi:phosphoribosylglycinamide formyltransferase-1
MDRPRIIVFASGTSTGGGSGFENLLDHSRGGDLEADIVAVVSNHEHGGVRTRADRKGVRFIYFDPVTGYSNILKDEGITYAGLVQYFDAHWVALSGWMKKVSGLDPRRTFNIHPALLSHHYGAFGGVGMYGHHIHDAVKAAYDRGEITETGFSMHFVTDEYDRGPIFYEHRIPLTPDMDALEIARQVREAEHAKQPRLTNLVVHERIAWDGMRPESLRLPSGSES